MNSSAQSAIFKSPELKPGEQIDDLQLNSLKVIQKTDAFRFGTDSVLLADFVKLKRNSRVIELGSGCGVISLLMYGHNPEIRIDAVELQHEIAEMSLRSISMNSLENVISIKEGDLRNAWKLFGAGIYDTVVCNPPYYEPASGAVSADKSVSAARTLEDITINEICQSAFKLLKSGGRFSVVFPAKCLFELMSEMEKNRLAPKRVRLVYPTINHIPKIALIDAVKQGGAQLDWLPPLILQNEDGTYTKEWHRIYG